MSSWTPYQHLINLQLDAEAATGGVLWEKVLLEISENSQENTCASASFLMKLQAPVCNFIKKRDSGTLSSCEFCEISKNTFFTEYLRATASLDERLMNLQFRSCVLCKTSSWHDILLSLPSRH